MCLFGIIFSEVYKANCNNYNMLFDFSSIIADVKGIIGLPANLFYGTGIAASIIIIDKEDAEHRKGIFMIDAGKGFIKDGNKNRLREQDIHQVVDVFNKQLPILKYSRMVPLSEIKGEKNNYNLNIPRYIDRLLRNGKFIQVQGGRKI